MMSDAHTTDLAADLNGILDPSLAIYPNAHPPQPPKLRLPDFGVPSCASFEAATDDYIASLHPTKQAKTILQQDMYEFILRVLNNPSDTSNGSAIERHWVRDKFELGTLHGQQVPLRKSRSNTPCASRDMIYDIILDSHVWTAHGGRDKTFNRVKERWAWIPKETADAGHAKSSAPSSVDQ
ncbi:hypothetical protein Rt10032_c15g5564 [Rhodotorula toruloides]|uniref:Integrase zinc-binding domain-containing protein n=1 Tax=Rhodotorula toruloides TaxID=5286 RepID=A0A511KMI5_RHOTO|nr:hypothetical protein Rt10032_c15g5564 [Rhodotorula toruloides]